MKAIIVGIMMLLIIASMLGGMILSDHNENKLERVSVYLLLIFSVLTLIVIL